MRGKLPPKPVNDEYVALINVKNGRASFGKGGCIYFNGKSRPRKMVNAIRKTTYPRICIVLESPHKDEYQGSTPLGPALSTTGRNLKDYFLMVLNQAIANKTAHLRDGV